MAEDIKNGFDGMSYEATDASHLVNGTEIDFQQADPRLKSLTEIQAKRAADEHARPIEKEVVRNENLDVINLGVDLQKARKSEYTRAA